MPPDPELINLLKEAHLAGRVAYSRQLCEAILQQHPDHGPTLLRQANVLIGLALYDEAAVVLDHAASAVPAERQHLVAAQRGHRLQQMGNFSAAEEQYLMAHDLDPDDATYLIYAASAAFDRGDIHRAEEVARRSLSCGEGCLDEAHFNLGGYLVAQKRYSEARECYLRALEIDPDYTIAKERLADVESAITAQAGTGAGLNH